MRWLRQSQVQRLGLRKGSRPGAGRKKAAVGEIVWSWCRDPGAKPVEQSIGHGGKKGRFPGESTYKPQKPLRGESRDVSAVPVKTVCILFASFRTRRCGCIQRPAFPAPSVRERDNEIAELGQIVSRE
jgi:hypothetical protein